ncbi:MAG TPA: hypothetical protein VE988_10510 [Gemmataceae bacterium]|nr:hypothetical protein [Gemmataceae bacterium]
MIQFKRCTLALAAVVILAISANLAQAQTNEVKEKAKKFLTQTDRAKGILNLAHPTSTLQSQGVEFFTVEKNKQSVPGHFIVAVKYSWRSSMDNKNYSTTLDFYFDAGGNLYELRCFNTNSDWPAWAGVNLFVGLFKEALRNDPAVKNDPQMLKMVNDAPDARQLTLAALQIAKALGND